VCPVSPEVDTLPQLNQLLPDMVPMKQDGIIIPTRSLPVAGQEPTSIPHQMIHGAGAEMALVVGVITKDPEPFGQLSQHGIRQKDQFPFHHAKFLLLFGVFP
jgi:hypothetical protein